MHTVRGLLTSTFWQSLVGTVSQISCFFSVHSCLGTILQTGVEISVHFLVGKGKHVSLWTIPAMQHKKLTLIKFMVISMIYITNQKGQMLPRRSSTLTCGIQISRFSQFKAYNYFLKNFWEVFSPLFHVTFQCGRKGTFKKKLYLFFVHENMKKLPSKVAHNRPKSFF